MKIGCCDAFKKCSDAGVCIRIGTPDYEEFFKECYYSDNLEMGKNFYTEYNDNNRARAEEYKRKQENIAKKELNEPEEEILQVDNELDEEKEAEDLGDNEIYEIFKNKYMNAYLDIDSRQFFIGTRGGYHSLTYTLGSEGIEKLVLDLSEVEIYLDSEYIEDKYSDEYGSYKDRADWRVVVTISDTDYHILNSDTRSLRRETATMIADYFSDFGFKATCECIGNSRLNFTVANKESMVKVKSDKSTSRIENKPTVEPLVEDKQISLFDL